jgi:hypothetical protein
MTDSIKHLLVLIFQVKVKRNYLMQRKEWELMWIPMGKGKLIDEIFGLNAKETIFNRLSLRLSKGNVTIV